METKMSNSDLSAMEHNYVLFSLLNDGEVTAIFLPQVLYNLTPFGPDIV